MIWTEANDTYRRNKRWERCHCFTLDSQARDKTIISSQLRRSYFRLNWDILKRFLLYIHSCTTPMDGQRRDPRWMPCRISDSDSQTIGAIDRRRRILSAMNRARSRETVRTGGKVRVSSRGRRTQASTFQLRSSTLTMMTTTTRKGKISKRHESHSGTTILREAMNKRRNL